MGQLRSMKRQATKHKAQKGGTSTTGQIAGQIGAQGMVAEQQLKGGAEAPAEQKGQEATPEQVEESEAYQVILMKLIHSPESRESVAEMLKSGEPAMSLPKTALTLNKQGMSYFQENKGRVPSNGTLVAGVVYMVQDLIEIGNMTAGWSLEQEKDIMPLIQITMKTYIHEGLRDGTLDAVELQRETEPLLNKAQRDTGLKLSQELEMPGEPTAKMGVNKLVQNSTQPLEQENAQLKGQLAQSNKQQQAPQQAPPPQQGGMA